MKVKLPTTDATTQINKNIHNKILHSTNLIYVESCIIILCRTASHTTYTTGRNFNCDI